MSVRIPNGLRVGRLALVSALATVMAVPLAPAPALADHAVSFSLLWIRCQDQNEAFSDEPYVQVNGVTVREFSNVDTGDTVYFFPNSYPFNGAASVQIRMWESDNPWTADELMGTHYISHDDGPGEHEAYFFEHGEYILRYYVQY